MIHTAILGSSPKLSSIDPIPLLAQALASLGIGEIVVIGSPRALGLDEACTRVRFVASAAEAKCVAPALVVLGDHLVAPAAIDRLLDAENTPSGLPQPRFDAVALVDRSADRAFDPASVVRLAIGDAEIAFAGALVATPSLLAEPDLLAALTRSARQGRVETVDVGGALWHRMTDDASRRHGEWLLRVCGAELEIARPGSKGDGAATRQLVAALLDEKDARPYVLLNPGPVLTSARVKSALVHHDVCHRDADYTAAFRRLQRKLARVFRAGREHTVLMITGSGTAAMEASIASTVPRGKKLLVISNGAFGERLLEIAETHFLETVQVRYEWGETVDPTHVERALAADPAIFAVAMIHHETSVGLLNPVGEIGALCRRYDRLLIADAVASLGGEDLDVVRDQIDICFSSSNKCLHGIAGVSFVCVSDRVWPRIEGVPPRSYYLDLRRYRKYADSIGQTPFTPAVTTFFALEAAVDELLEKGLASRPATYKRRNRRIRAAMRELGLRCLTATGRESSTMSCVRLPAGLEFATLYREMKSRGYIVYDCKDALAGRYFQVANMGELDDEMIDGFLAAFREVVGPTARARRPELRLVAEA